MGIKLKLFSAIVIAFVAYFIYNNQPEKSPIVVTKYGKLQGIIATSRDGRSFYEYLGIPYAKPPIGELRYESPQPPEHWHDVRDASRLGFECAQFNNLAGQIVGDEDCLFLNVFTPKLPTKSNKELLPVLVFIHGGGFIFGSSNMYRPDYFMDEDIVLVTLNYRLASLGFLNTGDGIIRGNMGLKDQSLALKWVQENIANFGGNPKKVTIYGESAGGASVHFQLLSPMSKGLVHKAISHSGNAIAPWAVKPDPAKQAKHYASKLNCLLPNTKDMVKCLKNLPIEKILEGHSETKDVFRDAISMFGPTIETINDSETFLSENPYKIVSEGKAAKIPYITGYNAKEGLLLSVEMRRNPSLIETFLQGFNKLILNFMVAAPPKGKSQSQIDEEMTKIKQFYFESKSSSNPIDNFTNLFTDYMWAINCQETVKLQSQHSQVYLFYYSYEGEFQLTELLHALKGQYPATINILLHKLEKSINKYIYGLEPTHYGTGHGDELAIFFRKPRLSHVRVTDKDYKMSKDMIKLWVSFVKDEKILKFKNQIWSPIDKNEKTLKFFHLSNNSPGHIDDPNESRSKFIKKFQPYISTSTV